MFPFPDDQRQQDSPRQTHFNGQDQQSPAAPETESPKPDSSGREDCLIVALGASAGGVKALQAVFEAMPAESGMAFVVVLHISPSHASHLGGLLSARTTMPVLTVEGTTRVEPNHVYVIPPAKGMTINDGHLYLHTPDDPHPVPRVPIDAFLRSLAADCREKAAGIVLSGTGGSGTLGLQQIKAQGGMTMAQDPQDAEYDAMPHHAIEAGIVDHVLPVRKMPAVLLEYARHPYVSRTDAAAQPGPSRQKASDLQTIVNMIRTRAGYDFRQYKTGTLQRRIERRMGLRNRQNLSEYIELLRSDPEELQALRQDLLIRVTNFFRDREAFETLQRDLVSEMVRRAEETGEVRGWVPACSTGEEAYSIAILLFDQLQQSEVSANVRIFASDVDEEALQIARTALYPSSIEADVPTDDLHRFFVKREAGYQVGKQVRDAVVFARQNVIEDPPFSQMDLVSCRNLLIYLNVDVQQRVLNLLHFALREGGYLFLGKSESADSRQGLFEPVSKGRRIYRRIGPTRHQEIEFPTGNWEVRAALMPPEPRARSEPAARPRIEQWARQLLMDRFAPACVVVNGEYGIQYFSGATHDYLVQPIGAPTHNLLEMAREGLEDRLRSLVNRVFNDKEVVVGRGQVRRGEQFFPIQVTIVPLQAPQEAEGLLLVTFQDVAAPPDEAETEAEPDEQNRVRQLEHELAVAREDLHATIEKLQTSIEEYKTSNEEVRSMNEELLSINEELETSKEELQSLNEELASVNYQLESNVAELQVINDDLNNLLRSTEIATVFLDREFRIRRFTEAARQLFNVIPGDIGRPISDITRKFTDEEFLAEARRVLQHLTPVETEVRTDDDRWYLRRILPYRTEEDRIGGVVITFTDITGHKRFAQELQRLNRTLSEQKEINELLRDVTAAANRAEDIEETLDFALKRVSEHDGWLLGHAYLPDVETPDELVLARSWYRADPHRFAAFRKAMQELRLKKCEGLPGRVYADGKPGWTLHADRELLGPRAEAARRAELKTAAAFPILVGERIVGVLEFFSDHEIEPDERMLESMASIGTQLGRVVERRELEKEIADATAHQQVTLGQELHDSVAQQLSGVLMMTNGLRQRLAKENPDAANQIGEIIQEISSGQDQMRRLMRGLMPVEIDAEGITAALEDLGARCREIYGIPCTFTATRRIHVENSVTATQLYRIAQEAIQNASKHAAATQIEITLKQNEEKAVVLRIHDDGKGVNLSTDAPVGMGLKIMRYRARVIGADLHVESHPGEGTTIVCTLPEKDGR